MGAGPWVSGPLVFHSALLLGASLHQVCPSRGAGLAMETWAEAQSIGCGLQKHDLGRSTERSSQSKSHAGQRVGSGARDSWEVAGSMGQREDKAEMM